MNCYADFLASKAIVTVPTGIEHPAEPNPMLFPFQRDIVKWALRRGRAAIFADCGMGKTPMQLSWAEQVHVYGPCFDPGSKRFLIRAQML